MNPRTVLTPGEFIERYGRYFNRKRIEAIQGLGFLFVEGAAGGPYFDDAEGKRFLDMGCMGGTFSLGHRNPAVVAAGSTECWLEA
jgi:putrescine aminotransferase